MNIVFGPVPSRRLGKSVGINNIPNKICSYNCVYCQLGNTVMQEISRKSFYSPAEIYNETRQKIETVGRENVDYITFVPDGEPTLDINIGKEAALLKKLDIPLAIITNSSLISDINVQEDLLNFDFVSFKVDAVSENIWNVVDRPDKQLVLRDILNGILEFKKKFNGQIVTETMLIDKIDYELELSKISDFLGVLDPDISYIAIPIRPPSEKWVVPPSEKIINYAYQLFGKKVKKVEYLIEYEGNEFSTADEFEQNLLSIVSVHPMREDAILEFLSKYNKNIEDLENLINEKKIMKVEYQNNNYYIRRLKGREALLH
jgi:wyosine [tRNA(Phe)-imidazoG37] synthetase (radical SAM superfamily)